MKAVPELRTLFKRHAGLGAYFTPEWIEERWQTKHEFVCQALTPRA